LDGFDRRAQSRQFVADNIPDERRRQRGVLVAKHIADVANADPTDIGLLLLERIRDRATCFGDDQKRALDNVLRTRFAANCSNVTPSLGYASDCNEHVLEGDSGIARHQKTRMASCSM
jgi:hypothetical protein